MILYSGMVSQVLSVLLKNIQIINITKYSPLIYLYDTDYQNKKQNF